MLLSAWLQGQLGQHLALTQPRSEAPLPLPLPLQLPKA